MTSNRARVLVAVQDITPETGDDHVLSPDTSTVAPDQVRSTVTNTASQLTCMPLLAPGQSETTVTEPGTNPSECTSHTALARSGRWS
jgi:hypothetical protein